MKEIELDAFGRLVVRAFNPKDCTIEVTMEGSQMPTYYPFDVDELVKEIIGNYSSGVTVTKGFVMRRAGIRRKDVLADGGQCESFDERVMCDEFSYSFSGDDLSGGDQDYEFESRDWDNEPFPVEELMKYIAERRLNGDRLVPDVIIEMAIM